MGRKQQFFSADFSEQWKKSYAALQYQQEKGVDKVVMALLKGEDTPGMRIKPIEPDKYYYEARYTDGGRIIYRHESGTILFVDIVSHDDIGGYGRRPK